MSYHKVSVMAATACRLQATGERFTSTAPAGDNMDDRWTSLKNISLIGNYLPRRCGIATFTTDLTTALAEAAPHANVRTLAMNDRPEGYRYGDRVWFEVHQPRLGEYRQAAEFLNMSHVDVVCLQHEFGIFGGEAGGFVLDTLDRLRMPVVTTMHTVLKDPEPHYRQATQRLVEASDKIVVMADRAVEFLREIYGVPQEKIRLIHHGIPDVPFVDPNFFKDQFGVEGKKVILTFGLLGPSKGLENMIRALPAVIAKHPDAVYLILGATHPGVLAHSGEDYRLGLQRLCRELGVEDQVHWYNKFVELDELTEFLGAADVYVTPYDNEAQITSGTLAYALGAGKATVSTPYWYAQEMFADGRGKLVPFKDSKALGDAVNELFDEEVQRHAMRKRAFQFTRQMRWAEVASQYLDLFDEVRAERAAKPKPVAARKLQHRQELAEIKLDHLATMTDTCGIVTSAKATVPDRRSGYSTDQQALALIAVLMAQDHLPSEENLRLDPLPMRYLSFLDHAFEPSTCRFRSTMTYERRWDTLPYSDDTQGRALRGLGETVARSQVPGHVALASDLFHRALPICEDFHHPHAIAQCLIGIHAYLRRFSGDSHARRVREVLAGKLHRAFRGHVDDWPWFSDRVTYTAGLLPQALLLSGRWMFDDAMIRDALRALDWLNETQTGDGGRFAPVGNDGWFPRGGTKARFDQLPQQAASSIDANLEAFRITGRADYLDRAQRCMDWFMGDNDLHLPVYDNATGGCCDKLTPHGVAEHQGTEATVSWLMALLAMYEQRLSDEVPAPPDAPATPSDPATLARTPLPERKTSINPAASKTPAGLPAVPIIQTRPVTPPKPSRA